jgi:hypothetical protein
MRNMAAVRIGVTRTWPKRAGGRPDRASDQRPRRGSATAAGNCTKRRACPGAHEPAADIDLCMGWSRRKQRDGDTSGREQ